MTRTRSVFCMVLLFVTSFGMLVRAQVPASPYPGGIPPAQTRADSAQPTQPAQPAAATRPEGVPEGYVITPFGYFDPSCVFHVAEGETLLEKGTALQHADGTVESLPACLYPHYATNGELVATGATQVESPTVSGWVEYASTTTSSAYGEIAANWVVPPARLPLLAKPTSSLTAWRTATTCRASFSLCCNLGPLQQAVGTTGGSPVGTAAPTTLRITARWWL